MRTHTDRPVAQGARDRQRSVLLGAVVLLGTSALVVVGVADDRPDAASGVPEMRSGPTLLRTAALAADAERAAAALAEREASRRTAVELEPRRSPNRTTRVLAAVREDPMVELGRRLFFDPAASHSKNVSCASCHKPEHGFSDPAIRSADDFGTTPRHSQTVLNISATAPLHWDGEFATIEDLVSGRTGETRAADGGYTAGGIAGTRRVTPVAESLAREGLYESAFTTTFGRGTPTKQQVSESIAAYVRTLNSTTSPFDRFLDGENGAMSPEAVRGFYLFRGRAGCAECHTMETRGRATFSDGLFHNTGIAQRPREGSCKPDEMRAERLFAEGRKRVTERASDLRAMKTPSLRDVATRAPYMHDGSFATLAAVVRYYAVECGSVKDSTIDPRLQPFDAGQRAEDVNADVRDLVAFLNALTGERRAGLAETAWTARTTTMRLKFVDTKGAPSRSVVALAPGGDVLPSAKPSPTTLVYRTPDIDGWITVEPFATTHVRVTIPGTDLRPVSGELVPDTCEEGVLVLASAGERLPQSKDKRRRAR
jgi:cytochrome c peroxidase